MWEKCSSQSQSKSHHSAWMQLFGRHGCPYCIRAKLKAFWLAGHSPFYPRLFAAVVGYTDITQNDRVASILLRYHKYVAWTWIVLISRCYERMIFTATAHAQETFLLYIRWIEAGSVNLKSSNWAAWHASPRVNRGLPGKSKRLHYHAYATRISMESE